MRLFPAVVPVCVLSCALALVGPTADADHGRPTGHGSVRTGTDIGTPNGLVQGTHRPQTSDGVIGPAARELPLLMRGVSPRRQATVRQVAPGLTVQTWNERDARGPIRAYLMTVKYRTPGLSVDYANSGPVQKTGTVRGIVARDHAIAGVNGDFYDIGRSGAPLGLGRDRQRGLLNGKLTGWNAAFSIGRGGWPDIGPLATHVRVRQHPDITIGSVNSPRVQPGSIGAYTPAWGEASGYLWTDGQRNDVRLVQVLDGKVAFVGSRLPDDRPFRGTLLIGRGAGAKKLAVLRRGQKATMASYVDSQPTMAITGNKFLVRDGLVTVIDDTEMHPRTAIGIDRDTKSLLILAIDGRQSFSRGYTMVELADMMMDLGADEALNLDGGGSTTMVARTSGGGLGVVNSPSDSFERSVANAISIDYRKPR